MMTRVRSAAVGVPASNPTTKTLSSSSPFLFSSAAAQIPGPMINRLAAVAAVAAPVALAWSQLAVFSDNVATALLLLLGVVAGDPAAAFLVAGEARDVSATASVPGVKGMATPMSPSAAAVPAAAAAAVTGTT